jgi:hypothetical protein
VIGTEYSSRRRTIETKAPSTLSPTIAPCTRNGFSSSACGGVCRTNSLASWGVSTANTSSPSTKVSRAAEGGVVWGREVACGAVSGKSLARTLDGSPWHGREAIVRSPSQLTGTSGAMRSSDDYGSSVERTAKLHPLWQCVRHPDPRGRPGLHLHRRPGRAAASPTSTATR